MAQAYKVATGKATCSQANDKTPAIQADAAIQTTNSYLQPIRRRGGSITQNASNNNYVMQGATRAKLDKPKPCLDNGRLFNQLEQSKMNVIVTILTTTTCALLLAIAVAPAASAEEFTSLHQVNIVAVPAASAQEFTNPGEVNLSSGNTWSCSYGGERLSGKVQTFSSVQSAQAVVDRIKDAAGMRKNSPTPFKIRQANVPNAAAVIHNRERMILYNPSFIQDVGRRTRNDWAAVSIMAHEMAHHINGHTVEGKGSRHNIELDADWSSGNWLARAGASLEDAQIAMKTLFDARGSETHPSRSRRLQAIEEGWREGCADSKNCQSPRPNPWPVPPVPPDPVPVPDPIPQAYDCCALNGQTMCVLPSLGQRHQMGTPCHCNAPMSPMFPQGRVYGNICRARY